MYVYVRLLNTRQWTSHGEFWALRTWKKCITGKQPLVWTTTHENETTFIFTYDSSGLKDIRCIQEKLTSCTEITSVMQTTLDYMRCLSRLHTGRETIQIKGVFGFYFEIRRLRTKRDVEIGLDIFKYSRIDVVPFHYHRYYLQVIFQTVAAEILFN